MSEPFDLDLLGGPTTLRELTDEVLAAGELALRLYRQGAAERVRFKPDQSPVTEADEAVENRLRAFVAKRFPGAGFMGEETGTVGPTDAALRFFVDPIDGTRAFVRGIPTWSVLVGVEHHHEPVLGIALLPADGDLFVAAKGTGATFNGRPVHLSGVDNLAEAAVCHGTLGDFARADAGDLLVTMAAATHSQRGFHDFDGYRQLLLGRVDAMIDPGTSPWDLCAAAVIVREAGGRFTSLTGKETVHGGGGIGSNGLIHDALLAMVAQ